MPVKRRNPKRRIDTSAGVEGWLEVFQTGFALFDDFTDLTGVELEPRYHPGTGAPLQRLAPALADSEAAWGRYGAAFLAEHGRETPSGRVAWALGKFGEPHAR